MQDFWSSIENGKCGIDSLTLFDTEKYNVKLAGEVKGFDPLDYMDKREVRRCDPFCQFAVAAGSQAMEESGLDQEGSVIPERLGVILGVGIGGIKTWEREVRNCFEKGPQRVSPFMVPMIIGNIGPGTLAIRFNARGICSCVVTACTSGTNALGDAMRLLQRNEMDAIITGGAEAAITETAMAGFANMMALSSRQDPMRASIPFDKERDGFVMGEGSGILVLETLSHARKRGAKIFAELVGYGVSCDAHHITAPAPEGEGAARAMALALNDAQIEPSQISYINAHGTSTPFNDLTETQAIKSIFGAHAYQVPISSSKSMFGHLLGAAGGVEALICVEALRHGFVPATLNYEVVDEELDLDYVPRVGRRQEVTYAMSNSLGFGGHNGSIIFKKWDE
jgi:3-oxoacyl-[acyl-carrier-protein] synthase II